MRDPILNSYEEKYLCENCGKEFDSARIHFNGGQLEEIEDVYAQVSPGERFPNGQCPECHSCVHRTVVIPDYAKIISDILKQDKVLPILLGINKELDMLIEVNMKEDPDENHGT